jgi:hypothetical protein
MIEGFNLSHKFPDNLWFLILLVSFFRWWVNFKDYFPISLIKTKDLKPGGKYIFGYHPHGIIGLGAISAFGTNGSGFNELFPGIRVHLVNQYLWRLVNFVL